MFNCTSKKPCRFRSRLDDSACFVGQALEKQRCQKSDELAALQKHAAQLASTRRCLAAGMDRIREMLNDNDAWMRHCSMDRPYMDVVNKTKVSTIHSVVSAIDAKTFLPTGVV